MYCGIKTTVRLSFSRSLYLFLLAGCAALSANAAEPSSENDAWLPEPSSTVWDGLYFGMQWGYGVGTTKWRDPQGRYSVVGDVAADGYADGLLGGVQVGYNRQYGSMVIGIEGDVNAGKLIGYATCGATAGVGGSGDTCGNQTDLMASLTGRLGYAEGRSLVYVKGGLAYSHDTTTVSNYYYIPIPPASSSANRYGWTVGAGVAYALDANWSVNAEYGYYDFGKQTYSSGSGVDAGSFSVAHVQQIAKFGLNYRLGATGDNGGDNQTWLPSNDLSGVFGTRVGYSSGRFQTKLNDPIERSHLNSIITWPDQAGPAAEAFARIDHRSGWFLKGTLGGVTIGSSKMYDEDFLDPEPYSKTVSSTQNGRDFYGTLDLGYDFLRGNDGNLGGFVGYGHYRQYLNGYGCEQIASNENFCPSQLVSPSALILTEAEKWNVLRLGLAGGVMLTDRLNLSGEAAWLAYASMSAKDNHWYRPDINPLDQKGQSSKGYQIEATLSYALDRHWSVAAGARYLHLEAEGSLQFPEPGFPSSPDTFTSSRYTAFLQAAYHFGR